MEVALWNSESEPGGWPSPSVPGAFRSKAWTRRRRWSRRCAPRISEAPSRSPSETSSDSISTRPSIFNTFFGLLTQDAQTTCFETVATHLSGEGVFLMEAFVPDLSRFDRGQRTSVSHIALNRTEIDVALHSPAKQRVDSQTIIIEDEEPARLMPVSLRYAWPAELDLMARLAGLRLRSRWGDWDRSPFGDDSGKHVSVWSR